MKNMGIFEAYYQKNPRYLRAFKVEAQTVLEARKIAEAYLKMNKLGKLHKLVYLWPKSCEGGES